MRAVARETDRRLALSASVGGVVVVVLTCAVELGWTDSIDHRVHREVSSVVGHDTVVVGLARAVTFFGSTSWLSLVVLIGALVLGVTRRVRQMVVLTAGCVVSSVTVTVVKMLVARPRPSDQLVHAAGFAFPSGHATNSMVVYGLCAFAVSYHRAGRVVARSFAVAGTCALAVAASRVVLNVHWFTDVVGGLILAVTIVCAVVAVDHAIARRRPFTDKSQAAGRSTADPGWKV